MSRPEDEPITAPAPERARSHRPRTVTSEALFDGGNEIVIRHAGREYRLRRTRLDKLILTA